MAVGDGPPIADAELGTALLQAIPDVVAIVRRDGVVEYVRLPGQHLGLEAQRKLWQGADMRTMMAPDDASEWVERIERCVDTGEPQTGVYEPSLPGAQMVWEIRLVRYSDDRALALARDVTEEFRKDRERKAAVDLMHGVASRVPLVLFVHDLAAGKNLYINRGLAEMLGYSPEDGLGEAGVAEFMHPDDLKDLPAMLDQLTESADGETVLQVGRLRAKGGGYRWVRSQTQCFRRDSQGQPVEVLGILEDITERRLLADQASRTAKMEAVGQLAASIAHDFNNLLTAMSLNISYLDELLGRGKAGHREVEELSTTLSRASVLTKHLLSFSQRASQSQRPIELRSLVGELVPFLRLLTGPRITVRLLDEHLPVWVLGEPNQLEQVLIILASNACDAMPGGGRLDIALAQKQGKSVVRVSDSGPGIAKDLVGRIFEPFFSTKAPGMGTGLGLASAQRIVRGMGGTIEVVDEGKGACFEITLPGADPEQADASERASEGQQSSRILVVEDDATLRRLICDLLESSNYDVECAADPSAALEVGESFSPDLVLCDVVLPSMSGIELAGRLRGGGTRVLYLTGTVARDELDGPYLSKPFTPAQLRDAVAAQLSRHD